MTILTVTLHPAIDKVIEVPHLTDQVPVVGQVLSIHAGGKGNNAARALHGLGIPVTATGFQGGHTGEIATTSLQDEGIDTRFVPCAQPTRTTTILHDRSNQVQFVINEPGQKVSDVEAQNLLTLFKSIISHFDLCLLCGSGQYPELEDIYRQMIVFARQQGVRCLLDSSSRALEKGIQGKPYLIKVNRSELETWMGVSFRHERDQVDALVALQQEGIQIAAVSRGPDGLLATDGSEIWSAKVMVNQVLNTLGCGDSTLAGMAYAILNQFSLRDVVRWGASCGAANTQTQRAGLIDSLVVRQFNELALLSSI